jgi:hypothetical protein
MGIMEIKEMPYNNGVAGSLRIWFKEIPFEIISLIEIKEVDTTKRTEVIRGKKRLIPKVIK